MMLTDSCVFGGIVGGISGGITGIFFVREDKATLSKLAGWVPGIVLFGGTGLYDFFVRTASVPSMFRAMSAYAVLFGGMLFITISRYVRSAAEHNVTLAEVWNGLHKTKIEAANKVAQDASSLAEAQQAVAKQQEALSALQIRLSEREQALEEQGRQFLTIQLRDGNNIPATQGYLNRLPTFVSELAKFCSLVQQATDDFVSGVAAASESADEDTGLIDVADLIGAARAYFACICLYLNDCFFGDEDARTHFRVRITDHVFRKVIAVQGLDLSRSTGTVSDMPYRGSMIERSFDVGGPVIASLNPNYHLQVGTKGRWKDYLTMTFNQVTDAGRPIFAIGIAFENPEPHRETMLFLCQSRIDRVIQGAMKGVERIIGGDALLAVYQSYMEANQ